MTKSNETYKGDVQKPRSYSNMQHSNVVFQNDSHVVVHVDVNIFNIFQIEMMSPAKWLVGHLHRLFNTRRL